MTTIRIIIQHHPPGLLVNSNDYAPSGRQHVWPMDKMSQNTQVFRHMTDIFVFRNYLGPSISNTFQTSWTHFRHLPDGLKTFQTPSRHLQDIFQTPSRAPQETLKISDIWPIFKIWLFCWIISDTFVKPTRHTGFLPDTCQTPFKNSPNTFLIW